MLRLSIVLLDDSGQPIGVADKATVHGARTPRHLAFSCYGFDPSGRMLVTRLARSKRTFPGVLINTCAGIRLRANRWNRPHSGGSPMSWDSPR